jgi:hypothetical protein
MVHHPSTWIYRGKEANGEPWDSIMWFPTRFPKPYQKGSGLRPTSLFHPGLKNRCFTIYSLENKLRDTMPAQVTPELLAYARNRYRVEVRQAGPYPRRVARARPTSRVILPRLHKLAKKAIRTLHHLVEANVLTSPELDPCLTDSLSEEGELDA